MTTSTKSPPLITEAEAKRPTESEERAIDQARAVLRRTKNAGNRQYAKERIAKVERGIKARVDGAWRREAIAETVDLAKERGESVETGGGQVRISSRDGLRSLRQAGHITDAQYAVGLLYRAGHEARGSDLKAQNIGDSSGGGHDNDHFVAARLRRARMMEFVARTDRAVALGCISHPGALRMLRSVVGEGTAITAWGHGRALARNREGIAAALDIARKVARAMAQDVGP